MTNGFLKKLKEPLNTKKTMKGESRNHDKFR